jgi:hypothetical protein
VTRSTAPPGAATCSRPRTPAGPAVALRAASTSVLAPGLSAAPRSTESARFHESVVRADPASQVSLSQTSTVSSPVTSRSAAVYGPDGAVNVRRR